MTFTRSITTEAAASGLALSAQVGISAGLAERITLHNEKVARVFDSVESGQRSINAAVEGAADGTGDLFVALESQKLSKIHAAQMIVKLWKQRGELASAVASEFRPRIEPAEAALAEVIKTTEAGLAKVGLTADAMVAGGWNSLGGKNPTAAAQQLRHVVRQALPVREAEAAVIDFKNVVSAAISQTHESGRALEVARGAAKSLAAKAAMAVA